MRTERNKIHFVCLFFLAGIFFKMTSEKLFFMLTRKPDHLSHINAGRICYTSKFKDSLSSHCQKTKAVQFVGSQTSLPYEIEVGSLEELSEAEAELLLALPDDPDRLKWSKQRDRLRAASELTVGTAVEVEKAGERLRGIIRYIGGLTEPTYLSPLPGRYFGVELQVRHSHYFEHAKFCSFRITLN